MARVLKDTRPFARFEWMLAMRYLRSKRREGFISVISIFSFLGIMLGVATLIVVMSVMNGFRTELLDKILGFGGHATIVANDRSQIANFDEMTGRLLKIDGIRLAIPYVEGQALASSSYNNTGVLVRGVREDDLKRIRGLNNDKLATAWVPTTREQLEKMIQQFSQGCARPDSPLADVQKQGQDLFSLLLEPVIDER